MLRLNSTFAKIVLLLVVIIVQSCVPVSKLSYFNDIDQLDKPGINPRTQKLIMPFDRLYIKVLSTEPETNQIFSNEEEMRVGSYGSGGIIGYMVDESGNINFPFVGNINVGGSSTSQASEKLQKALSEYIPHNLAVSVKFVDNHVTVMGEVQRQGVYNFTQDKISIYEALGLGGGITRYGNRRNIILTRQVGEKIMFYKLNLSNSKVVNKDYYYVQPNDVIIVEPLSAVASSYQNITYTTVLSSVTTLIAVLLFTGVKF